MRPASHLLILSLVLAATCCQGMKISLGKVKKMMTGSSDSGSETVRMTPEEKANYEAFLRAQSQQQQPQGDVLRLEYGGRTGGRPTNPGAITVWNGQQARPQPPVRSQDGAIVPFDPSRRPPEPRQPKAQDQQQRWSPNGAIVPYDPSRAPPEMPENYFRQAEKAPAVEMNEDGLRLVTKQLFFWTDKLTFEEVVEKLEALEPSYHRLKKKSPLDTRELLSFSQDIDEHCHDQKFYDKMVKVMKKVEQNHRPLVDYMKECLTKYQFMCQSDLTLTDRVTEFKGIHGAGLKLLDLLKTRMAQNRGLYQHYQLGVYSLSQVKDRPDWGGERGNTLFINTCTAIRTFRDQNHLDRMDPAWRNDENIGHFMTYVELCRHLEKEGYKDYLYN